MDAPPILPHALGQSRAISDRLFGIVAPDAMFDRPIPERHRIIFYLGHLEAFDWNLIARQAGLPDFHAEFDHLFAFGIDPKMGDLPGDTASDWPSVEQVRLYCCETRRRLDAVLPDAPEQLLHVALEHRLMHAETLAYILHQLPYDRKRGAEEHRLSAAAVPEQQSIHIPAGLATLGLARAAGFGWDNEFEAHTVHVPAFSITRHKVTNADYLEFVKSGGSVPAFWRKQNGDWRLRAMFAEIPVPPAWPAYVTHDQAAEYARWRGARLPSEAEYHRAAYGMPAGVESAYPWGDTGGDGQPAPAHGNFDFRFWDPVPVNAFPAGDSAFGVSQLLGNGWEWTSTPFAPFAGFEPFPFYPGYSADFFDGEHYVLKGASPRTASTFLRRSFRNWFRRDYPYVYATFRLVEN